MTARVGGVVCQRAVCEGQLVRVPTLSDEATDKVSRPDVVNQIAEELASKRVVPEVLNDAAAVGVAVGDVELFRSECRVLRQQERLKRILPSQIDDRFVGKESVTGQCRRQEQGKQRDPAGLSVSMW